MEKEIEETAQEVMGKIADYINDGDYLDIAQHDDYAVDAAAGEEKETRENLYDVIGWITDRGDKIPVKLDSLRVGYVGCTIIWSLQNDSASGNRWYGLRRIDITN